jgi:hypothetical protein
VRGVAGLLGSDLPFLSAKVTVQNPSGYADVDMVMVEAGATVAPQNRVYTSTTDLGSTTSEYFKNLQFDHASTPGTITLPFAETEHIGAQIFFEQINAALLTIAVQSGDTLQSSPNVTGSRSMRGRYARAYAEVINSTTWRIYGELA